VTVNVRGKGNTAIEHRNLSFDGVTVRTPKLIYGQLYLLAGCWRAPQDAAHDWGAEKALHWRAEPLGTFYTKYFVLSSGAAQEGTPFNPAVPIEEVAEGVTHHSTGRCDTAFARLAITASAGIPIRSRPSAL